MEDTCDHPDPALCKRLNRHIHGRLWDIWNDKVLTPEQCAAYRAIWEGKQPEQVAAPPATTTQELRPIEPRKPCNCGGQRNVSK